MLRKALQQASLHGIRRTQPRAVRSASMAAPSGAVKPANDVLLFWFGDEWNTDRGALSTEAYFGKMMRRWWGGGDEMDADCKGFAETIRAVGNGHVSYGTAVEGRLASVLLCDQLSRGAFRGSAEAFAFDEAALKFCKDARAEGQHTALPAAARQFLCMPLLHSEELADQEENLKEFEDQCSKYAQTVPSVAYGKKTAVEHLDVVRKFGRFPHRNAAKGRTSTPDELEWLASPDLPGFAKSQLPAH